MIWINVKASNPHVSISRQFAKLQSKLAEQIKQDELQMFLLNRADILVRNLDRAPYRLVQVAGAYIVNSALSKSDFLIHNMIIKWEKSNS